LAPRVAMTKSAAVSMLLVMLTAASGSRVSPVQKVIELLDSCKAKVQSDLDADAKAMAEYTAFCDKELEEKGLAIKTATRSISELDADVVNNEAVISAAEEDIAAVTEAIAEKEREMASASAERATEQEGFAASQKEMVESIDEIARAVSLIKQKPASFLQASPAGQRLSGAVAALSEIVKAGRLDTASHKRLRSLLQAANETMEDSDDLSAEAPKPAAFESQTGAIMETLDDMQRKAEDGLSELRKRDMESAHSFEMAKQNLEYQISNSKERLALTTKAKAAATEKLGEAQSELVKAKKTRATDEQYSETLRVECELTARGWAERQQSAAAEMGAIEKAKEILVSGVKVLVQVGARTQTRRAGRGDGADVSAREDAIRVKLGAYLKKLARERKNFALAQLASASVADPFEKVRGLIEGMISKLVAEAREQATKEAFCKEELGKSKSSKEQKEDLIEKHSSRLEQAEARNNELLSSARSLVMEIWQIDSAQKEATKVRYEEKAEYDKSAKDYRDSVDAVSRAIGVLRTYYQGNALVQVSQHSRRVSAPVTFAGPRSDAGSSIISILQMVAEDFTTLLAEIEQNEDEAVAAYEKLSQENKAARAAKLAEIKGFASEFYSLKVTIAHSKEDKASVTAELGAVLAYIEKLKPDCESKAMANAERKAAREAEIEGLKEALSIMEGKGI